jgi:hypothetical protein
MLKEGACRLGRMVERRWRRSIYKIISIELVLGESRLDSTYQSKKLSLIDPLRRF